MFKKIVGLIYKYKIYIKYIIAGGTAAATDLFLLFLFHDIFKINVVVSATLAFVIAFFVSFYLQKFWTFSDNSRNKIKQQMGIYFFVGVINAGINAIGMDFLVNKLQIWYILSQVIMCGSIALYSFIIYNLFIFKKSHQHNGVEKQSSRTNVLIATGIYPPDIGGPATYVKTLQEELPKYGSEVRVVTYADDLRQENGVLKVSRQQNIFFRYWQYFWIVFKLCSWAGIIYVQGPVSEGLPAFLACKLRIKKY
ncbi:MAG: GtrA family protein, partial [Candidatus Falkowbacteria bacterium]|nr:GtrA family protein [Candidatus Falkowbacteria bacterium]